jgi:hypothetical protein
MKPLLLTLFVLIQGIAYASDDKPEIGRYQLVYAVTTLMDTTGTTEEKGLWKIDTVTGQIWRYNEISTGKYNLSREEFVPVETKAP